MAETIVLQTNQPAGQPCKLHPQSMCPAFGSLRILTRIQGSHPVMATDTGCLYGLTFVTHFYGARKSIVAPTLGTAELMSGQVVEGTGAAIEVAAREPGCQLIPVISLCVAETAGMPEELLPRRVGAAEVVLVRVPAYAIYSHPEAKDVALAALLRRLGDRLARPSHAQSCCSAKSSRPTRWRLMGCCGAWALSRRSRCRGARSTICAGPGAPLPSHRCIHSIRRPPPCFGAGMCRWSVARRFRIQRLVRLAQDARRAAGARRGAGAAGGRRRARAGAGDHRRVTPGRPRAGDRLRRHRAGLRAPAGRGRRRGAVRLYLDRARPTVLPDELWLRSHGTKEVVYRKALEEDMSALDRYAPDLVLGTTPFSSAAKDRGIPGLYFTNQLASRPFFLSGGMAATIGLIRDTLARGTKYREMQEFFAE